MSDTEPELPPTMPALVVLGALIIALVRLIARRCGRAEARRFLRDMRISLKSRTAALDLQRPPGQASRLLRDKEQAREWFKRVRRQVLRFVKLS